MEVTRFELRQKYGHDKDAEAFITEICDSTVSKPHPQAPRNPQARLYKVLSSMMEGARALDQVYVLDGAFGPPM